MRRLIVITIALGFFALVAVPAQAQTIGERNADFIWSLFGDVDRNAPATMHDGRIIPLAQAINEAAARAGTADLAALANGAGTGTDLYVGDVWLLSLGTGGCTITMAPAAIPSTAVHPQAHTYGGGIGTMSGDGIYYVVAIGWTLKTAGVYGQAHWEVTGLSDFYCFGAFGITLAFPFVDGIVRVTPS